MSIVTLFVDTSDEKVSSERRFDKSLTISQLKVKRKKLILLYRSNYLI
jgi:tubulin-folding cofactor B